MKLYYHLLLFTILIVTISSSVSGEMRALRMPEINVTFTPLPNASCNNPLDIGNYYFSCYYQQFWSYYGGINGKNSEQYNISINSTHRCLNMSYSYKHSNETSWTLGTPNWLLYSESSTANSAARWAVNCAWDTVDMMSNEHMINGGLETWRATTDIDKGFASSASFSQNTTVVHSGTYSGVTTANNGYVDYYETLQPENYTFSFWYNCSAGSVMPGYFIRAVNTNSANYKNWNGTAWITRSGTLSHYPTACNGSWQYAEMNFSVDYPMNLEFYIWENNVTNNIVYLDDLSLTWKDKTKRDWKPQRNTLDVDGVTASRYGHNKWFLSYISFPSIFRTPLFSYGPTSITIDKDETLQTTSSSDSSRRGINMRHPILGWDYYENQIPDYVNKSNGMVTLQVYGTTCIKEKDLFTAIYDNPDVLSNIIPIGYHNRDMFYYNYTTADFSNAPSSLTIFGGMSGYNNGSGRGCGLIKNIHISTTPGQINVGGLNFSNSIIYFQGSNQWVQPSGVFDNTKYLAYSSAFIIDSMTGNNVQPFSIGGTTNYNTASGLALSGGVQHQFRYSNTMGTGGILSDSTFSDGIRISMTFDDAPSNGHPYTYQNTTLRNLEFINTNFTPTSYDLWFGGENIDDNKSINYTFNVNLYNVISDRPGYNGNPKIGIGYINITDTYMKSYVVAWITLSFRVFDNNYNALENVNVSIVDSDGTVYYDLTNSTGQVSISVVKFSFPLAMSPTYTAGYEVPFANYGFKNNYTITYSKTPYITQYAKINNLAEDYTTDVVMPSWVINGSLVIRPGSGVTII